MLVLAVVGGLWTVLQMAISRMNTRDQSVRDDAKDMIAAQAEITKMAMQLEFAQRLEANNKVLYETISNIKANYQRRDDFERAVGEIKAEVGKMDDKLDGMVTTLTQLTQRVIDALARSKPVSGAE